jgi:hypothetical protein
MLSPSEIDWVGHSGSQAPQEMHSSVIFIAMGSASPYVKSGSCRSIGYHSAEGQAMDETNVFAVGTSHTPVPG